MPITPFTLTLRSSKSPPASAPVGGELSSAEVDGNFTALETAVEELEAQKLSTDAASTIATTKPTPVPADQLLGFDSEVVGNPPVLMSIGSLLLDTIPDLPPLGLWDYWYWWRAAVNAATSSDMFTGAAVSAGTINTALPTGSMAGYNDYGVFLRSGTTANGGYRYLATSPTTLIGQYFGAISRKFRGQFLWRTAFTGRTVRMGFHDTTTSADATDGAYFEILDAVCSAKTANNSTRTTAPTTVTLSLDTPYTFDIDVNAAGTEARFRVYAGNTPTTILDQTITTNIPTTSARAFGAGIIATEASTTASDIGILYGLGLGTVEAFQTRDVAGVLGDINAVLASI
jgi:hypothetical protein